MSGGASTLNVPQSLDQLLSSGNQSPFAGSVPTGTLKPGVLDLSVEEAIDRGLKYNLGIVLSGQASAQARAAHLKELSSILPKLDGNLRESDYKANLRAEGFGLTDSRRDHRLCGVVCQLRCASFHDGKPGRPARH